MRSISRLRDETALALIVLLGLALRVLGVGRESLWFDEAMTVTMARDSFGAVLDHVAAQESHPPLYFWLVWAWMELFGGAELPARSLSVVCGTLAIVPAHFIARRIFDRRVANLAALLVATAPILVYYSQEARPYAVFLLLCLATVALFVKAVQCGQAFAWWSLVACAALATLTHYYMAFTLLALGGFALFFRRRYPLSLRRILAGLGVYALLVVPWFTSDAFASQMRLSLFPHHPLAQKAAGDPLTFLRIMNVFDHGSIPWRFAYAPIWTFLVGGLILALPASLALLRLFARGSERRERDGIALVALLWLLPVALVLALGFRGIKVEVRYIAFAAVPYYVLVALGVLRLPALGRALGIAALLAWSAVGLHRTYTTPSREDWRGALGALVRELRAGDAVLFDPFGEPPLEWAIYHPDSPPLPLVDLDEATRGIPCDRLWVLSYARVLVEDEAADRAREAVAARFEKVSEERFFLVTLALHVPRQGERQR
ncbi:MAG: glycosyltransferase family 39 protein [Planctomycetota bacterium]